MQATTTLHGEATGFAPIILHDIDPGPREPGYSAVRRNGGVLDVEIAQGCIFEGISELPISLETGA